MGAEEQIKEIEAEIKKTQYNKATQHHIGLLKAKIAKLRDKIEVQASKSKKGEGYSVKKSGDATVIMLGFPSVGKSTLLNALTNADSEVGAYEFTTLDVIPGMMNLKGAQVQLLDVPGIVEGAATGRGRGKEVLAVLRNADLCMMVIDVNKPEHVDILKEEVYQAGIRLDSRRPDVKIKRTNQGGIRIGTTCRLTHITKETMKGILNEMGYRNADVVVRENVTIDTFIDAVEDNKAYMNSLIVLNKVDSVRESKSRRVAEEVGAHIKISARDKQNLQKLQDMMWDNLGLIRIYMKEPGKPADMVKPLILKEGSTIKTVCDKTHQDFAKRFKFARVTGPSAKFKGQKLMLTHTLMDEDIVELHLL